ncbi:methyltransferase domain-containing protein [Variovorax sp. KK3]|uniref:methyltransferase domain-containing protein n=1 Tax=Variovorax sp. KK3 TaxID=1855728 RepID=UPI00117CA13F|nr:methyltransferase domain-containing protein [Variovorax sp. KK3]
MNQLISRVFARKSAGVATPRPSGASVTAFPFFAHPVPDGAADPATIVLNGTCPVCGQQARFDRFTDNLRESGFCSGCGSFNRQRQMAHVLRARIGGPAGAPLAIPPGLAVYNTESTGAVHRVLSTNPGYVCSEYFGAEYRSGETVRGCRHEDLQNMSFADQSLDIVLSSDVLEHMPDPYRAHREIFRVLRRGGRHIFTVPFDSAAPLDDRRADLVNGEVVYLAEKLYHGDPVNPEAGILVWTIFGLEMLVELARIGFAPTAVNLLLPWHGVIGAHSLVFEAVRP